MADVKLLPAPSPDPDSQHLSAVSKIQVITSEDLPPNAYYDPMDMDTHMFGAPIEVDHNNGQFIADQWQHEHVNIMSDNFQYQYANGRHFQSYGGGSGGATPPEFIATTMGGFPPVPMPFVDPGFSRPFVPHPQAFARKGGPEFGGGFGPGVHVSASTSSFQGVASPEGVHVAASAAKAEIHPDGLSMKAMAARAGVTPKGAYAEGQKASVDIKFGEAGAKAKKVPEPEDSEMSVGTSGLEVATTSSRDSPTELAPYIKPPGFDIPQVSAMHGKMGSDITSQEKMAMEHHIWSVANQGKLHHAPMTEAPQRVLDIGKGSGAWAMDLASEFPRAEIFASTSKDGSPVYRHPASWVNPNIKFSVDAIEGSWGWGENYFDFIHVGSMAGQVKDWRGLMENAYRHLKPGGYLEIQDLDISELFCDDGSYSYSSGTAAYHRAHWAALQKSGYGTHISSYQGLAEDAGFGDVEVIRGKQAASPWPKNPCQKEMGNWSMEANKLGEEGAMEMFTGVLGMEVEEARGLVEARRNEASNLSVHTYSRSYVFYAQKPMMG